MGTDEAADGKTAETGRRAFWRDGAWQAVGAIVAIVALVVAVLQWTADDEQQRAPGVQISGNCNPVGNGNTVKC